MSDLTIEVGKKYVDANGRVATIEGYSEINFFEYRPMFYGRFDGSGNTKFWDQHGISSQEKHSLIAEYKETAFTPNAYEHKPAMPVTGQLSQGVSLRDYMAAKVLQVFVSDPITVGQAEIAKASYDFADAMLAVRRMTS